MAELNELDVEHLASVHGFLEVETQHSATMGDHREWVHLSKVERLLVVWDPQAQEKALFVKLDLQVQRGVDPMQAHDLVWRKVKLPEAE